DPNGVTGNTNVKPSPLKRSMQADDFDESVPLQQQKKKKKGWSKKAKDASSGGSGNTGIGKDDTRPGVPSKLKKSESSNSVVDTSMANGTTSAGEKKKLKLTLKAGST
ncbi:hypothetical protein KEM56_004122, partial [Ascosphaera pollenicola]